MKPVSEHIICADLGGTKTRAALFDLQTSHLMDSVTYPTPRHANAELVLNTLLDAIKSMLSIASGQVQALVIGAPGPLDSKQGVILRAPLFPNMETIRLLDHVQSVVGVRTYVHNDANLAGLGEYAFGAGRGSTDMIYVTVSTGVGGGIILKGHLLDGHAGFGGEIGHICLYPGGLRCGCGHRGCLEAYSSGVAMESEARRAVHQGLSTNLAAVLNDSGTIRVEDIVHSAYQGDEIARDILLNAARDLSIGLASLVNVFNPDLIVIGGGVSNAGALYVDAVRAGVRASALYPMGQQVEIRQWELGDQAGLFGAFYYGRQMLGMMCQ